MKCDKLRKVFKTCLKYALISEALTDEYMTHNFLGPMIGWLTADSWQKSGISSFLKRIGIWVSEILFVGMQPC